jgi:hypothetical protein
MDRLAGHVTYGDHRSTVEKELKEEMGITIPKFVYLFREKFASNETHFYWFIGRYAGEKSIESAVDPKWITESDFANFGIRNLVIAPSPCVGFWAGSGQAVKIKYPMQIKIFHNTEGAKSAEGLTVIIDVFRAFTTRVT